MTTLEKYLAHNCTSNCRRDGCPHIEEWEIERLEDRSRWLASVGLKEKDVSKDEGGEYVLGNAKVYLPVTIQNND